LTLFVLHLIQPVNFFFKLVYVFQSIRNAIRVFVIFYLPKK